MTRKLWTIITVSVALLVLAGGIILAQLSSAPMPVQAQGETGALPRTITVVGEGKVNIKPDMAQTNLGVEVRSSTVKEASAEAKKIMEQVLQVLKAQGIADKDIQTSGFNIYTETPPYGMDGAAPDQAQTIYHVSNQVTVNIRDLDKVGAVIDAAIEAGANSMYGVTFSLADPSQAQAQARKEAVASAKAKGDELAGLAGVKVGQVVSVSGVIGGAGYYGPALPSRAVGMGGGGTPIQPGELEITTQLQVVYSIQ